MKSFLTPGEIEVLREGHKACRKKRSADRIKTILLLDKGFTFEEVAEMLMLDDSTIRRYLADYQHGGIDVLIEDNYRGGLSYLTAVEQQELKEHVQAKLYSRAWEVCDWVLERFGVDYSNQGMTDLLHRLGFSYKKTRIVPGKADVQKQEEFVEFYADLKENMAPKDRTYFMDGCHPMHNPIKGYAWILKGEEKEIPSNTGRNRVNLNGAYCPQTGKVIVREDERINAQSTILLLKMILGRQPRGMVHVIADNAKYYRSKLVKEYLSKRPRIRLHFLPPYSPNLNLQERIWRFLKDKIIVNRHYPTLGDFREAILKFFASQSKYKAELRSLMTENFQIIRSDFSQT